MTAGVGAFLFGGDVNIAAMAASNAVENNAFAHDAVTKEGLQRQQEELNAYRDAGVDLCKLATTEISSTWSAFLDRVAAPLAASYQENQQAMRQRDLSWLDRIHLNSLYRLLLAGAGLVPRNYLDCGLIAAPLARGARAAQGILAREGVLGAEALAPLGKIEVKPNVMFGNSAVPDTKGLMGEYRAVKGHHVHAKKAFEGHMNYDASRAFSISNDLMKKLGIDHRKVTAVQMKQYRELAASGRPNTLKEHTRIAVEALVEGGAGKITRPEARKIVAQSLSDLKKKNVRDPTNIPWDPNKK